MTTYRLMDGLSGRPGNGPSSPASYTGNYLAGVVFSPTGEMLWLNGYYWWVCNTGQSTAAQKFCLWNRYSGSAQALVPGSTVTSGTLTAGAWNYIPLASPVQLAPGGLYVAATGWNTTGTTGFPITNSQFATGDPYVAGIVNGPLTAWSDAGNGGTNGWTDGTPQNYGLNQGVFGTAGSDPTVNMPATGSASSNFWMDVLVSDQPPGGYEGSYRVWPNRTDLGNYSLDTANNFTLGMEFTLTQACAIGNVWFYSPATVSQLPTAIGVYQVSGTTLVASSNSPSWSGAAGSGWVSAPLTGTLNAGTSYKVTVLNGAGSPAIWNAAVASYWSTGFGGNGLTAGPISVFSNATADSPGQETYNAGASLTYPATNAGPYAYGLDIELTPQSAPAPPAQTVQVVHSMRTYP